MVQLAFVFWYNSPHSPHLQWRQLVVEATAAVAVAANTTVVAVNTAVVAANTAVVAVGGS